MDKIKKYQDIIVGFLERYQAENGDGYGEDVKHRILSDRANNSFQLLTSGWSGTHYLFGPVFHFDIINGKIWMQCNNTEYEVVDELMAEGVDNQDIVLGFLPPHARKFSGFAVA